MAANSPYLWIQLQLKATLQGPLVHSAWATNGAGLNDPQSDNFSQASVEVIPMNCQPRPKILVEAVNNGDGRLRVTVTADTPLGTLNRLERLNFLSGNNGLIDIGSVVGSTGAFSYTLGHNEQNVTFFVRRSAPGAVTIPLAVVDHCSTPWLTFVGGGQAAF